MTTMTPPEGYKYWVSYTLQVASTGKIIHRSQEIITTMLISTVEELNKLEDIVLEQIQEFAGNTLPDDLRLTFSCWPQLLEEVQDYDNEVDRLRQHNAEIKRKLKGEKPSLKLVKSEEQDD